VTTDAGARRTLLAVARASIADALDLPAEPAPGDDILDALRGAFVTLMLGGRLRGCIGQIEPDAPLRTLIPRVARLAAFEDPRFRPLPAVEFPIVRIELSLLELPAPVTDVAEIDVGVHGVIVEHHRRRALLLPQVAVEWNWTREELLAQVCMKASLPADAWKTDRVRLYSFTADVFGEDD
jgi:AmmeMemoRadiSam system protein A